MANQLCPPPGRQIALAADGIRPFQAKIIQYFTAEELSF